MKINNLKDIDHCLYSEKTSTEQIMDLTDAISVLVQEIKWLKEEIEVLRSDVDFMDPPRRIGR